MRARLARAYLDAADDALGVGGGGYLHAIAVALRAVERVGEVDCRGIDADVDGVEGAHGRGGERRDENRGPGYGSPMTQTTPPNRPRALMAISAKRRPRSSLSFPPNN